MLLEFGPGFLSYIIRGACCGPLGVKAIGSVPFDDNLEMYWVGWAQFYG